MDKIQFENTLFKIDTWVILKLPKNVSAKLPSRGQAMVKATLNGCNFKTALEPDGRGSHWFKVDNTLLKETGVKVGDTVSLTIEPIKDWPEPEVPNDIKEALVNDAQSYNLWKDITPMARWDWIRWIRATKNNDTRIRRIQVALSKLKKGERRPCCFNRVVCTEPSVSHNGVLLEAN